MKKGLGRVKHRYTGKKGPGRNQRFKPRGFRQRLRPSKGEGSLAEYDQSVRNRLLTKEQANG